MQERKEFLLKIQDILDRLKLSKNKVRDQSPLTQSQIVVLCNSFKKLMLSQPMLLELNPPVVICGDIHGQFRDLLEIFQEIGEPGTRNYLFLGDYVDRGRQSLECICLLMALKVKHPTTFFLLRGNHESSRINKVYGFYDECKRRLNLKVFKAITDAFNYLPVAAVVGNRIFCVHGGLSPYLSNLASLNQIKRPTQAQTEVVISDLLWSDPATCQGWETNFERGVSLVYGKKVIQKFLKQNQFDLICRSHQVVEQGYQFFENRSLITIFSAPNYCGTFENFGAVMEVSTQMVCSLVQFKGILSHSSSVQRSSTPLKHEIDRKCDQNGRYWDRCCQILSGKLQVTSQK